jgi:FKBP-type peptidyl-prolyl cis-trans isomerase
MTGKSISMWAIVIIVLIGGGILYWQFGTSEAPAASNQDQAAAAAAATGATTTPQVAGQDVTIGSGKEAKPGSVVSVLYVGRLQDGTVFDSSETSNNNQPLKFQLGSQDLIPGFQIGVNGMKEGGERRIAIPPEFAYGTQDVKDPAGKVIIPANSTIVFDVRLVKVEDASTTPQQ